MADSNTPATGAMAVLAQAGALWGKQSKGKKTAAIAIVLAVLGGVGYATLVHHGQEWTEVSENASPDDTSELYALLQARDIPARLHEGKVEIPSERASEARAIAASHGLPHANKGLGSFDNQNLGISSFGEQVNYRRGIEGELDNTIASMAQVESARVLVSFGKASVFKDQEVPPSASVALHLHAGQTLTSQQVQGIRQLVAKSIEGLKPDEVVLVDQYSNLLDAGDTSGGEHKADVERATTRNVRAILERVVGPGKVSVVTTADFDTTRTDETEEIFDKDHPAVRSESRNIEGPNATAGIGGVAGTQGNLPGATPAAPTAGSGAPGKLSETKNYEISRKVRQTTGAVGSVKKLHVAIVVDVKADAAGKPVARTPDEMKQLTALARTAAGLDDARGDTIELASIAFAAEADAPAAPAPPVDWTEKLPLPLPIMAAAAGGVLLLILAVAVVMMIRRARRRARKEADEALPLALPAPLADIERVLEARPGPGALGAGTPASEPALPPGPSIQERVLTAVAADVERAAAVLTSWLAEPPPKGSKP